MISVRWARECAHRQPPEEFCGLGFVHDAGTLPFVYDMADLYKHLVSIPAAFIAIREKPDDDGELVRKLLKLRVEEEKLLQRMPKDLEALFTPSTATPSHA